MFFFKFEKVKIENNNNNRNKYRNQNGVLLKYKMIPYIIHFYIHIFSIFRKNEITFFFIMNLYNKCLVKKYTQ